MPATCTIAAPVSKILSFRKSFYFLCFMLLAITSTYSQTNTYSAVTGNWSNTANWSLAHIPIAAEDAVIPASAVVTVDVTAISIKSLSISGTVTYPIATVRTITVASDVTINAGGILQSGASATFAHVLSIGGNFTNNGTFNALASANNKINITFTGAASNSFTTSATAATTFSLITLNKGTSNANILDFNPSNTFSFPATGALAITNGTFKLNGSVLVNNPVFAAAAYTIPATGGFWLNNANASITGQAGNAIITGLLRVSSGTYNAGTLGTHTVTCSANTSSLIVDGGTLNTTGAVTLTASLAATPTALQVSSGTANIGTLAAAVTTVVLTANANTSVTVSGAGTINTTGSLTTSTTSSALTIGGAGAINIAGNVIIGGAFSYATTATSTFGSLATSTVTFTANNNSSLAITNGILNTKGPVSLAASVTATPIQLQVSAGAFNIGNLIVANTTVLSCAANTSVNVSGGTLTTIAAFGNVTTAANGTIQVSNGTCTIGASLTNTGFFNISNGTVNIGSTSSHNLVSNGATGTGGVTISGGALNITGKLSISNTNAYNQSNGTVTVATLPHSLTNGTFVTATGNSFTMTGGTIVLQNPNTFTTPLDYNVLSTTTNITTGVLQIGNASTPASSTFNIQGKTPNIVLNAFNDPGFATNGITTVLGDMTLNGAGTFTKGNFLLNINGNSATNPGNITIAGTNAITFTGTDILAFNSSFANQVLSLGSGSITSNQTGGLTINNTFNTTPGSLSSVTIPAGLTMIDASVLTLTAGILKTNLLTMGTTATTTISGGTTGLSYIDGALIRTFTSTPTSANSLFPVGKNGVYLPINLTPTNTLLVQLKAEAFTTGTGTNISPSVIDVYAHYWQASNVSATPANVTNLIITEGDASIVSGNLILSSATNGALSYQIITPSTSAFTAATPNTLTSGVISNANFMGSNYYAFGSGCASFAVLTGPNNICIGATSQLFSTKAGTWASSDNAIATVDASGNVTGVTAGSVTITFTDGSGTPCSGLTYTRNVTITNCSVVPGGVGNNLISWYKGDDGLSSTTWTDKVGTNTLTASGTPAITNTLNFNPVASFNGTTDYYNNATADGWLGTTNGTTYYYVATPAGAAASRVIYGRGTANGAATSQHGGRTSVATGLIFASGTVNVAPAAATATGNWGTAAAPLTNLSRGGFNGGAPANFYVNANGEAEVTGTSTTPTIAASAPFYIGRAATSGSFWNGNIAEVIAFNGKQTSTDYNKVQSYLALKYGITLNQTTAQDYIASDGTTKMWNAAAALTVFNKNIFGIGRDNAAGRSGLDQRVSRSVNTGTILTVATTNDFISTNQDASRVSLSNLNFITFADNGGSTAWTNDSTKNGYAVLFKKWQAQQTGSSGAVYVQFNLAGVANYSAATTYYLLYDADGNNDYVNATAYPLSNGGSGNFYSPASAINFANGSNFTIAVAVTAPFLGVNRDNIFWLKGDVTGLANPVATWPDASGATSNATQVTSANRPAFSTTTNLLNFNPQVLFNGTNQYMQVVNSPASKNYTLFAVNTPGDRGGYPNILVGESTNPFGGLYTHEIWTGGTAMQILAYQAANPLIYQSAPTPSMVNVPNIMGSTYKTGTGATASLNGLLMPNIASPAADTGNLPSPLNIGYTTSGWGSFTGPIAEMILYNSSNIDTLSNVALFTKRIQSYLALKYGITLDQSTAQNYLASDGTTTMWNAANAATGFNKNIFGIGRDDSSALNQKVSGSVNSDGSVLTIATDNNFTVSNQDAGRTTSLNNLNFETIANDNGTNVWTSAGAPAGYQRLTRQWQAQETGTIGTVYAQFDTANAAFAIPARLRNNKPFYILTDPNADGDYTDGLVIPLTNTGGSLWSAAIDFTNNSKFTLAMTDIYAGVDTFLCSSGNKLYALTGTPATGTWAQDPGNPAGASVGSTTGGIATADFTSAVAGIYRFVYNVGGTTDTMKITFSDCLNPGAVPGAALWLKANANGGVVTDGTTLTTWSDNSLNNKTVTASATAPIFKTDAASMFNFNPSVKFDGSETSYTTGSVFNTDSVREAAVYVVHQTHSEGTGGGLFGEHVEDPESGQRFMAHYPFVDGTAYWYSSGAGWSKKANLPFGFIDLTTFVTSATDNSKIMLSKGKKISDGSGDETHTTLNTVDANFFIGSGASASANVPSYYADANIAEIVVYPNGGNRGTDKNKIESYLALKYGITLDQSIAQNYLASDGTTTMWNAANAATGFNNDIFGIGRDDSSALNQKVSQSVNDDGGVLTIAADNNFTVSNQDAARTTSLANLNFETIANDNGAATWTSTGAPAKYQRLSRQWQVQETGTTGTVYVQFDTANAAFTIPGRLVPDSSFYLITDPNADGDYTDGVVIPLTNTSGSLWSTAIDFTNGAAFTIATALPKPNAGIDRTTCLGSAAITIAGTTPATGTWTEQAGNPTGVTLSSSVNGIATAQFTSAGVYHFVYTAGATDTMQVTVTSCTAAPGGVMSNLALWLKAGNGTNTTVDGDEVAVWNDQVNAFAFVLDSSNAGHNPASAVKPQYVENAVNYNPGVDYTSSYMHRMSIPVIAPKQLNSTMYLAGKLINSTGYNTTWMTSPNGFKSGINEWLMEIKSGNLGYYSLTGGADAATSLNWAQDNAALAKQRFETGKTDVYSSLNGSAEQTLGGVLSPTVMNDNHRYFTLGSDNNLAGYPFGGYLTETFVYQNGTLSATDEQKIESYMALKYGVTMDNSGAGGGNYILSDGTTVWDASAEAAYHNQVIGLVRDDASGLTQKQSHTQDDKLRIFLGSLAADNVSNAGTITNNLSSIVIGNQGGSLQNDDAAVKPAGIPYMFGRAWKITKHNFADPFSVEVAWDSAGPFNISDIRLLVSTTPDFSSATVYDNTSGITFGIGSIIIGNITTQIPNNSTVYFTVGSASVSTTLPVGMTAFNTNVIEKSKVALSWQTSVEINNDHFTIEKSADGNSWEAVTVVKGAGNSSSVKTYSAVDKNPYTGVSYYRVKQTDKDGNFKYSVVRSVKIDKRTGGIVVYPNPVVNQLTIKGDAAELKTVKLYNLAGQDVSGLVKKIETTGAGIVLDVSKLAPGVYNIKTNNSITKVIKQ